MGAENNRVEGIKATNDLEMPGGRGNGKEEIIKAVKENIISEKELDKIVERIIQTAQRTYDKTQEYSYNQKKHHEIALKIAEESVVLLKNKDNILPIKKTKIAVIGDMVKEPRYQGAGSSTINPYNVENALECLRKNNIEFEYAQGYERVESGNDGQLLKEAVNVAKRHDKVLIFAGLTENYESEGVDRETLQIPTNQIK